MKMNRYMAVLILSISTCLLVQNSYAQNSQRGLDSSKKVLENSGVDLKTIEHFFSSTHPRKSRRDIKDNIKSLEIWHDEELADKAMGRAEITLDKPIDAAELQFVFEDEPVLFNDKGKGSDAEPGDGIFTASVALKLSEQFGTRFTESEKLEQLLKSDRKIPVFNQRQVVQSLTAKELLDAADLSRGDTRRLQSILRLGKQISDLKDDEIIDALQLDTKRQPILTVSRINNGFDFRSFGIPNNILALVTAASIDVASALMVTAVNVVEDANNTFDVCTGAGTPGGPWTFAHLMREMSQGTGMSAEDFTLSWLSTWILPQAANGIVVSHPGRAAQIQARIINPWLAASGGVPDLDRFPARLMAIVNRPDLANATGYADGSGGEARFVFGLLDTSGGGCNTMPFTVIFEYAIEVQGCFGLKSWTQQWKDLDANPVGSAAYNDALEIITRKFTDHGSNASQLPNQSSLGQIRTNENALNPLWELREFTLQGPSASAPGLLELVTVKQTPRFGLNNSATLAAYISGESANILANNYTVPNKFPSLINPFLGATSPTPFNTFWNAPGVVGLPDGADIRHNFSLNTCSGCHARETNTLFTHIGNLGRRNPGSPAALSGFLTGINVTDPVVPAITRSFNDLAQRQQKMAQILNSSCFVLPFLPLPLKMVH